MSQEQQQEAERIALKMAHYDAQEKSVMGTLFGWEGRDQTLGKALKAFTVTQTFAGIGYAVAATAFSAGLATLPALGIAGISAVAGTALNRSRMIASSEDKSASYDTLGKSIQHDASVSLFSAAVPLAMIGLSMAFLPHSSAFSGLEQVGVFVAKYGAIFAATMGAMFVTSKHVAAKDGDQEQQAIHQQAKEWAKDPKKIKEIETKKQVEVSEEMTSQPIYRINAQEQELLTARLNKQKGSEKLSFAERVNQPLSATEPHQHMTT